jgi:ATP phosphoribosyltransferase regulatory subunit
LIAQRNLVALRERARAAVYLPPESRSAIADLALLRGGRDLLARLQPLCTSIPAQEGLARLDSLLVRAQELGYGERLAVDFALLRDLDYYTGFIFEGYVADLGFSLCGGGRYDALLGKFGYPQPAVGWSASVERLLIALERRRIAQERNTRGIDVLVSGSDVVAAQQRAAGRVVRVDLAGHDEDELLEIARAAKIPKVICAHNGAIRERNVTW